MKKMNQKVLLILVGLVFLINCREYAYFLDMHYSPAVDAQERDLMGERQGNFDPPENTIPHKSARYTLTTRLTDYPRADAILKSPFKRKNDTSVLVQGKNQYRIYCAPCHGVSGKGDGAVQEKWPSIRPLVEMEGVDVPPLRWGEGRIYHVIRVGIRSMQGYASQITEENRWAIAHYVKHLQGKVSFENRQKKRAKNPLIEQIPKIRQ